jgi:hypothetical protein
LEDVAKYRRSQDTTPLPLNFALECAIRSVHENQKGLKLNATLQLQTHADDINILGENINTIQEKNAESLLVVSKEVGLEVNREETKYTLMTRCKKEDKSTI